MELNDFPKTLVQKTIRKTLNPALKQNKIDDNNSNRIPLFIPYEKGLSEGISRVAKKFNVRLVNTKGTSLKQVVQTKQIQKLESMKTSGVVYKVRCKNCTQIYIGETGRELKIRLNEHKRAAEKTEDNDKEETNENLSGLSQHLKNKQHQADWNNAKIIKKESNHNKRKLKEAIAIKNIPKNELMNKKEEIKVLSSIWENVI